MLKPLPVSSELRYLSLVVSGPREDRLQDKLYAFYMEKNDDLKRDSELWIPRVAQICMVSCVIQKIKNLHLRMLTYISHFAMTLGVEFGILSSR